MNRYKLLLAATLALLAFFPAVAQARVVKVSPGGSIQAAVDRARPGDTVLVAPGTYTESSRPCPSEPGNSCAIVVEKDDISIVGQSGQGKGVTLEAGNDQDVGIDVGKTGDPACLDDPSLRVRDSLLRGLTVRGFEDDGVLLFCVQRWRVTEVVATDNEEYGIFPSHSFDGRLDHSFASGANDTGMYVGQSFGARIDHNVATDNVSGYEIENSVGVKADRNLAYANTGGILSFTLPNLDVKVNHDNVIAHNIVRGNNRPNTCLDPGDTVCQVPSGTGILVLAADSNTVEHNQVTGNDSFGIGVANFCVATGLSQQECAALDIEPNPDDNRIVFNTATGNGLHPDPSLPPPFARDLVWDGTGTGNCWSNNVFDTSFPASLPSC